MTLNLDDYGAVIYIPSNSDPRKTYAVRRCESGYTCNCPSATYRGYCAHLSRAYDFIALVRLQDEMNAKEEAKKPVPDQRDSETTAQPAS